MIIRFFPRWVPAIILGLALEMISWRIDASPVKFVLDDTQSRITVSGNAAGNALKEQGPGSLVTGFAGTINADVTGSTIRFTGLSAIDARTNGLWEPGLSGAPGSAPADYGAKADTFIGPAKGSFRNIILDLTSAALTITNGSFDASALVFSLPTNGSATFDFEVSILGGGSRPLAGYSTNKSASAATLTTNGDEQRLAIIVDAEFKFRALADNDSTVQLAGRLVATRSLAPPVIIGSISVTNQTATIIVDGANPQSRLESSTDLKTWSPRASSVTTDAGRTVFMTPTSVARDFFRIVK